jgi:hypothetical protein
MRYCVLCGLTDAAIDACMARAERLQDQPGYCGIPCTVEEVPEGKSVAVADRMTMFERDLERLINKYSLENVSDTPDFLLAAYLRSCLDTWNAIMQRRFMWCGGPNTGLLTDAMRPPGLDDPCGPGGEVPQ